MDKFVTRSKVGQPSSSSTHPSVALSVAPEIQRDISLSDHNLGSPNTDPGDRKSIAEYSPNIRDEIRKHYIQMGHCQPTSHDFPKTKFGKIMRQFYPGWFKGQHSKWLEYNISKDAAYYLCCYLFKNEHEIHGNMGDAFTKNGFKGWNKAIERFRAHVGEVNSIHNKCFNRMIDLMNQSQSIRTFFEKQSEKEKSESRRRLSASIDVVRFLLRLGLPFRGHDESQSSTNRGIFLELLQWYGDIDPDIESIILENAPKNEMMCSPMIQKDIVDVCAKEAIKAIIEDLDGNFFEILVNESKDISHKEQMELVLRYVNKEGEVIERFVGIVHVNDTSAQSLKKEIDSFLLYHSLSPSQIRGQGYDGASNMQGELRGLKTLILNETPSAYCIHCFAHQLQLTLVALAKKHSDVDDFFCIVTNVLNIVGSSFKRRDLLQQHQAEKLEELLISGKVHTGRGLNQERGLQRPGDTRWGSHYRTLNNLIVLFSPIIHVLEFVARDGPNYADKLVAESLMTKIKEFEFVFMLHLMWKVLMMTNDLSSLIQRMDQDIVNAMGLFTHTKQRLQRMRN
uniref:Zinc finger MYM-type protein 1-like n=1 Tax=Nicotiana tabacum TaxID=4097 RepID=A0A1S3Z6H0_TOBAC